MATSPDSVTYPEQFYGVLAPIPAYVITVTDIPEVDPTGNDDSTIGLQMAADILRDAGGGTLFFPPGTYRRTAPIILYSNTRVEGAGNARIIRTEGFANDHVFQNPNYETYDNTSLPTTPDLLTDVNYQFEGLTFESITICQFLFAANITIKNCTGDFSNEKPASFIQFRGCDNVLIEGNTATYCSAGIDIWQGCTRVKMINNIFKVYENLTGAGNKYGIGVNALGGSFAGSGRNTAQVMNAILIDGNSIETNGTAAGIQFDTLQCGSTCQDIRIINNSITGASGTTNYGIYGRGTVIDCEVTGNTIRGANANLSAIHVGSAFGGPTHTGIDGISTTSGSDNVVVSYPNNAVAVGGWVRVTADPNGPTVDVGGIVLNGYYEVVDASPDGWFDPAATVTIDARATASGTASGGGPIMVIAYIGNPQRCQISRNKIIDCTSAGPLITANGTGHYIIDNDMSDCDPANYTALTFTDQLDRTATATAWGCVVEGNIGAPGTGVPGANNPTRNAYSGLPLIIEPRNSTATPSWWIKGETTFQDGIRFGGEATAWTPALTFGGAAVGMTYTQQAGVYTRVGNLLFFSAKLQISAKGSSVGVARLSGFPVAISGQHVGVIKATYTAGITSSSDEVFFGYVNSTTLALQISPITTTALDNTNFGGTAWLYVSGWYFTA